jgi:hypothetical protein
MKYNCPYCDANLKWKLQKSKPLPGERKILPKLAFAVCSVCDGRLATNQHWTEKAAFVLFALPFALTTIIKPNFKTPSTLWGLGVTFLICFGFFAYFNWRYWRNMQRYKRFER